ncbi:hypothetical protein EVAR_59151_1 [Eumeta japonica]|uniref:Uncharacterized protein n=1 Tax=Eumeta variegata TaxID=151549 RepID=A0A4C1YYJ2_EUMVA|nr:hypothetical protein EVAR_59151_1 [Eumeta japonica]
MFTVQPLENFAVTRTNGSGVIADVAEELREEASTPAPRRTLPADPQKNLAGQTVGSAPRHRINRASVEAVPSPSICDNEIV